MGRSAPARLIWHEIDAAPATTLRAAASERYTLLGWGLAALYSLAFWLVVAALLH